MSVDQDLASVLRDVAEAHVVPEPDLAAITAGGRRRQRARDVRRGLAGLASVAVLAAVPFAVDLGRSETLEPPAGAPTSDPDVVSVRELPLGDPPSIPYCDGSRRIVLEGQPVEAPCDVMIPRGDSTLHLSGAGVGMLADGQLIPLDGRSWTSWYPAVSNDGRWAAWVVRAPEEPTGAALLVYDLTDGSRIAEVPWSTVDGWVPGIDDLGRVYFVDYGSRGVSAYDLRTRETLQVSDVPRHLFAVIWFVTADGFGIDAEGSTATTVGTVTADGRFTEQHLVQRTRSMYSPDRSRVVHETSDGFVVSATGEGEDVTVRLPEPGNALWHPVWESADTLLFQFDPASPPGPVVDQSNGLQAPARRTWLLRCDATDGRCEVAMEPGWAVGLDVPIYR